MSTIVSITKLCLFSSKSCPYAHRCEIAIKILGLAELVSVVYCDPVFSFKEKWKIIGSNNPTKHTFLKDLYEELGRSTDRVSLPTLYDPINNQIIYTDSVEIIKFLNLYSNGASLNLEDNDFFLKFEQNISTGTYLAGHAKTQENYKKYFNLVFDYLDQLNNYLVDKIFVSQNKLSMLDVIVYCHLIRFDPIFYNLFSLNKKHLWEYTNICRYLKNLLTIKEFRETTDIEEIKRGGYLTENNLPQNLGYVKVPLGSGGIEHYF